MGHGYKRGIDGCVCVKPFAYQGTLLASELNVDNERLYAGAIEP